MGVYIFFRDVPILLKEMAGLKSLKQASALIHVEESRSRCNTSIAFRWRELFTIACLPVRVYSLFFFQAPLLTFRACHYVLDFAWTALNKDLLQKSLLYWRLRIS